MAERRDELLAAIFARIREHPHPAYAKGSDLGYLAVNAAYARLFGRTPEDMAGLPAGAVALAGDLDERERRCLVFGTDERARHDDPVAGGFDILLRRERVDAATTLLTGWFEPPGAAAKGGGERQERLPDPSRELGLYRALLDELPVASFVRDEEQRLVFANRAYMELTGRTAEEIVGRTPLDIYSEQGAAFHAHNQAVLDSGELLERETSFRRHDGTVVPTISRVYRVTTLDDKRYLIGSITDTTALRKREDQLIEAQRQAEEVGSLVKDAVSSMSQGLLIIEDGRIVLSNEALFAMTAMPTHLLQPGARLEDLLKSCVERGVCGFIGERRVEVEEFGAAVFGGEAMSLTLVTGRQRWVRLDVTPTSHGRVVLVFTDITDLKSREEELRRLVVRAETADKAKSEFLANMSHEIRTPMNGVLGMAELLAKSSLDTRQKTFIDIMVKSGNALLTIINDILDFSKIDAGQMALREVSFSPVEAIEDVATLLSARAAEKDIELVVRGAAQMPAAVLGDAGRFRQIVTNLVGNAVKFTERGHVLIELESRPHATGVEIAVRVEDTGAGIPADKMASIFEKFSQVDASSTRRHEGTGLGLAIADGLTRLFGGTLSATSEVGRGSVFTVRLPMALAAASLPSRLPAAAASGARVLVVDPHAVSREATHALLRDWGFDATAVGSAANALAVLAAAADVGVAVDVVLFDYQPDIGPAFVRAVRQGLAAAPSLVVLTSMNLAAEDGLFSSSDIQAHLMKPVRAELLRETLCEVVRGRKTPPARPTESNVLPLRPPAAALPSLGLDVLVAEDNEVNRILFTQLLEGMGLGFRLVENGAEAVEAFRTLSPCVILMDVSMPVMSGLQASRAIRAIEAGSGGHVPIIAVTAHVLDEDREACRSAGMDDYLVKPISIDRLEEKLARWLKREGGLAARLP